LITQNKKGAELSFDNATPSRSPCFIFFLPVLIVRLNSYFFKACSEEVMANFRFNACILFCYSA